MSFSDLAINLFETGPLAGHHVAFHFATASLVANGNKYGFCEHHCDIKMFHVLLLVLDALEVYILSKVIWSNLQ